MKLQILKYNLLILLTAITIFMTGCKSNPELDTYKANMEQFFENIKVFDSAINSIDPLSENASADLLDILDSMETSFSQMASLEVPDNFPGVEDLADEASSYMTEAVSCYHQAFDGNSYNASMADVAKQNYDRANVRIQYIVSILHGEIPEEIYVYEDETNDTTDDNE